MKVSKHMPARSLGKYSIILYYRNHQVSHFFNYVKNTHSTNGPTTDASIKFYKLKIFNHCFIIKKIDMKQLRKKVENVIGKVLKDSIFKVKNHRKKVPLRNQRSNFN